MKNTLILLLIAFSTLTSFSQIQNTLNFDGVNDYIHIGDDAALDFGSSDFTVECWVKIKESSVGLGFANWPGVTKWNTGASPGTNEWALSLTSNGNNDRPRFAVEIGTTRYFAECSSTLSLNKWEHLACVREGSNIKIYFNGILEQTTPIGIGAVINNVGRVLLIGTSHEYLSYPQMEMDEVRIWTSARSINQIRNNMNGIISNPASETNLLCYYQFDENSGISSPDETGNGFDGTLNNFSLPSAWITSTAPIPYYSIAAGNWNANGTWASGQYAPVNTWARVQIKNAVTLSANATAEELIIDPSSSLTVNPGIFFTVNGSITNNAGTSGLVIKADGSGSGSLINGSAAVSGTIETYITPNIWHFVSSPVSSAVSGLFLTYYLQKHNETTNLYSDVTSVTSPLNLMQGYALYTGTSNTFSYTGNFNTGAQGFGLTRNNSGWNLTGNPYPSSIDWDAASGWTKTNVNDAVYVENNGGWATYISGVGTNGGTRYIAPGQGFFVECSTHPGNLAMTDAVRVHNNAAFFKNEVSNLVRIEASGNEMTDETVIRFDEAASVDFDGMLDAYKLAGTGNIPEIYSFAGSRELSINALPSAETIQLGFRAPNSGTYNIAATEVLDIANVILEDKLTGEFTDLQMTNHPFVYSTGEDADRFVLHFTPMSVENTTEEFIHVYAYGKMVYLNLKADQKAEVRIFNLLGQEVKSMAVSSETSSISLEQSGIYLVKVSTADRSTTVKVNIE
jgi:hypothetical protein